jgi:hypothetical protein
VAGFHLTVSLPGGENGFTSTSGKKNEDARQRITESTAQMENLANKENRQLGKKYLFEAVLTAFKFETNCVSMR